MLIQEKIMTKGHGHPELPAVDSFSLLKIYIPDIIRSEAGKQKYDFSR